MPNTTIASTPYNNLIADIGNEITGSLPTSGVKAMSAALPMGGNRITGMADPGVATDGATKNYVDTAVTTGTNSQAWKAPVVCATTANITLSAEQTIDGIATAGSRVLVKSQTAPAENGIYISAAGAWARATDMDAWTEVPGAQVWVNQGTTLADSHWSCTGDPGGTIGTTAITWVLSIAAGGAVAKSGDTMTGNLTVSKANPGIVLNKAASGQAVNLDGQTAGVVRWSIRPGDGNAESGGNTGSGFQLIRYTDAGAAIDVPIGADRSTGVTTFSQRPVFGANTPWDTGNKPNVPAPDFWAREELTSGTAGGGYTAGADAQCPLNTSKRNVIAGASLASNQITLPAGTYYAKWRTWAGLEGLCQSLLFNVTDAATIERGDNGAYGAGVAIGGFIAGAAFFTIASAKVIEIRFRGTATRATDGLGQAASFGTEVYRDIEIWKVA